MKVFIYFLFCLGMAFSQGVQEGTHEKTFLDKRGEANTFSMEFTKGDLQTALALLAKSAGLELRLNGENVDSVSFEFQNFNFQSAMDLILRETSFGWKIQEGVLVVGEEKLLVKNELPSLSVEGGTGWRMFTISYPRFKRKGVGASQANISSAASGEAGAVSLTSEDEIIFWEELFEQLKMLLDENTKITINKMSGVVFVRGKQSDLVAAQRYLEKVVPESVRQVEIEARIYEVTLTEQNSLGVDWQEVSRQMNLGGVNYTLAAGSDVVKRGPNYLSPSVQGGLGFQTSRSQMNLAVEAMREQGNVKALSKPTITTLNNQPAMIKVGTDLPYFSATVTIDSETGSKDIVEQTNVVTLGVILSITPQISKDGWITLGVDPMVTDLVSTATSSYGSTAPVVDVKQSSSMVRIKEGQTAAISGLIHNKTQKEERGVPFLSEIPFVGSLFKWTYDTETRKELVIFLTPHLR